jgi:ABC-2 type transport system ATP-binding protein
VLLVTHDLDQAQRLADRVGFLRSGEKVLEGAPEALLAEAFGDRMEVEVDVVEPAPEAALAAEGLIRADRPGAWVCLAADGYGLAGSIARRLHANGVEVTEVRVRRPSLHHLFARVVEQRRAA